MIIKNNVLLYVGNEDLTSDGVLIIPEGVLVIAEKVGNDMGSLKEIRFPDSLQQIKYNSFCSNYSLKKIVFGKDLTYIGPFSFLECPKVSTIEAKSKNNFDINKFFFENLKEVIIYVDGKPQKQKLIKYNDSYFFKVGQRNILKVKIDILERPNTETEKFFLLRLGKSEFCAPNIQTCIKMAREEKLMKKFDEALKRKKADMVGCKIDIETILHDSMLYSLDSKKGTSKADIKDLESYIIKIDFFIRELKKFEKKYKNADFFGELTQIPIEQLFNLLAPIKKTEQFKRSCTKLLKSTPINQQKMESVVLAGFKNPGAFPVEWLKNLPKENYAEANEKLHSIFKKSTINLYSPNTSIQDLCYDELYKLSNKLSKELKLKVEIRQMKSGNFSKTFSIKVEGCKPYVWKIYHSGNSFQQFHRWDHDSELQNSFLLSGKKYQGKIKFRKIATAGISNQRGERYLIYPYTEEAPDQMQKQHYPEFSKCYSYDFNSTSNIHGQTITDVGAMRINEDRWQGAHFSKIINTILYRPWDDLFKITDKYDSKLVKSALDFLNQRNYIEFPEYNLINAKLLYLQRKLNSR